jgi:hypothetical protein
MLTLTARTDGRFDAATSWLTPAGWRPLTRVTFNGLPLALLARVAARSDYRIHVRSEICPMFAPHAFKALKGGR